MGYVVRHRRAFAAGLVAVNLALVGVGLLRTPGALAGSGWLSLAAVVVAQLGCLAAVLWIQFGTPSVALAVGVPIGLVTGLLYGLLLLGEFLSPALSSVDAPLMYVILGGLGAAAVIAGWVATRLSGRFRSGLAAAACSSVAAYLIWYPFVLGTYYVWWSGPTLQRFLLAEGDLADFRRSGMTDFRVFFIRDNFGAGFYHLLLNLLLGLAFGSAAAALAMVARRRGQVGRANAAL